MSTAPLAGDDPLAQVDDLLRERGLRATKQRRLVAEAVRRLGHATPEQVHEWANGRDPSLNLSTVYRTLELLQELGVLTHTHLSHATLTYHLAAGEPHAHLVCRTCGAVTELDAAVAAEFVVQLTQRQQFRADLGHLAIHGLCGECA